ncbi:hypothetical protein SNOG_02724 [Parastagonospora nodorum SN15]|uniref:Secreted protein n=1 Tax=Phaeosphaeria nodorum (strain SN15 / ATCC MYA-4574 / FGSC 10173) TaxID=321614 RepID=Q0UZU0_PHANO|nr:hypothetical protein SNOG_02724 [Parastagonospora nodorum SN15]EAT89455.1 hypothetical protein SNOG_02724 [Parastagonospora nodorum SN15]
MRGKFVVLCLGVRLRLILIQVRVAYFRPFAAGRGGACRGTLSLYCMGDFSIVDGQSGSALVA